MALPDGAMEKVNAACMDFTVLFSKFMLLGFFEVAIDDCKKEASPVLDDDPDQLLPLPVPDWILKSGYMTKEGGNFHSWKKRWFVARNAKQSFVIDYYSDDKMNEKDKKGSINCAGYRAKKDSSKKPNGITLVPDDEERREWHIACESEKEQGEWLSVFENATWHAKPAGDPDPTIQSAFEIAFNNLKNARGFTDAALSFDRGPAEMLTKLLVMDLDQEVIPGILAEVNTPGGIGVTMARASARKVLVNVCVAACGTAWKAAGPAIGLAKTVVDEKVKPGIKPIIEAQVALKEKITTGVLAVATPVTTKLRDTVFAPLCAMVFGPMAEAFKAAVKGFNIQASKKAATLKNTDTCQSMISDVAYSYWSESPMVEAYGIIRSLNETKLGAFCEAIEGVSAYSFIYKLDSMLRDLLRRAIYTMHKYCADMDPAAALAKTLAQLVHDAKNCFKAVVAQGFQFMIGNFFATNIVKPCVELVKPIEDAIPEAFKTLLSIEGLLEEALNDIVAGSIKTCTYDGASNAAVTIDGWQG